MHHLKPQLVCVLTSVPILLTIVDLFCFVAISVAFVCTMLAPMFTKSSAWYQVMAASAFVLKRALLCKCLSTRGWHCQMLVLSEGALYRDGARVLASMSLRRQMTLRGEDVVLGSINKSAFLADMASEHSYG